MKAQLWRREQQSYAWFKRVNPRMDDIDTERHINNVALKSLLAEGRMRFQLERFPDVPAWYGNQRQFRPIQMVTNYLAIAHYPETLQCGLRVVQTDEQQSAWAMALFQHGQCVTTHEVRVAAWEGEAPASLTIAERQALRPQAAYGVMALPAQKIGGSLRREDYPIGQTVSLRYGDKDAHWCLNDLVQLRCIEQLRASTTFRLMRQADVDHRSFGGLAVLMASKRVRFLRLSRAAHQVEVRLALARVGTSSLDFAIALFDEQGCFAVADGVSVLVDPATNRPVPIPDVLRDALLQLEPVAA